MNPLPLARGTRASYPLPESRGHGTHFVEKPEKIYGLW